MYMLYTNTMITLSVDWTVLEGVAREGKAEWVWRRELDSAKFDSIIKIKIRLIIYLTAIIIDSNSPLVLR